MAVYEQTYRRYAGPLTPRSRRWMALPRYVWERLAGSKLVIILLVVAGLLTLGAAMMVYLEHNVAALTAMQMTKSPITVNSVFFHRFLELELGLGFLLILIAGPPLISMDLANGALPLYFARPLKRREYLLGKFSLMALALSLISWVPALVLFVVKAILAGAAWFGENAWIAGAIVIGGLVWILVLSFLTLALSAAVRWPLVVRGLLLVIFLVLPGFSLAMNAASRSSWGNVMNLPGALETVIATLFARSDVDFSLPLAWLMVAAVIGFSILLLAKKLRAYEVVS